MAASPVSRKRTSEISGFGVGEEGERGKEGLSIGESELNFSANVDDKFYASSTVAIVQEDGSDKIELEEAYIQTLPDAGLPDGLRLKAGRAFWTLGYLNEHHMLTQMTLPTGPCLIARFSINPSMTMALRFPMSSRLICLSNSAVASSEEMTFHRVAQSAG